jgi:hypothetical protein
MHVKALFKFDNMIIQILSAPVIMIAIATHILEPNPNSNPYLDPYRIAMFQDALHKKDDDSSGEYSHNSRARVHERDNRRAIQFYLCATKSPWVEIEKKRAL